MSNKEQVVSFSCCSYINPLSYCWWQTVVWVSNLLRSFCNHPISDMHCWTEKTQPNKLEGISSFNLLNHYQSSPQVQPCHNESLTGLKTIFVLLFKICKIHNFSCHQKIKKKIKKVKRNIIWAVGIPEHLIHAPPLWRMVSNVTAQQLLQRRRDERDKREPDFGNWTQSNSCILLLIRNYSAYASVDTSFAWFKSSFLQGNKYNSPENQRLKSCCQKKQSCKS